MSAPAIQTPVAIFVYQRPEKTRQVLEAIARVRPPVLMIVADGPRNASEEARCQATRATVEQISWDCEVLTDYAEVNLGLKRRMASGLAWVFDMVEEAIMLEDDAIAHPSFFRFCEELLGKYRDEPRVMHISGHNTLVADRRYKRPSEGYFFSRYPQVKAWATWKRAWHHYDADIAAWVNASDKQVYLSQYHMRPERLHWETVWDAVASGEVDTWDYQWSFACMKANGLCILPHGNLITDVGFGPDATYFRDPDHPWASLVAEGVEFPLKHPLQMERNARLDTRIARQRYFAHTKLYRFYRRVRRKVIVTLQGIRRPAS